MTRRPLKVLFLTRYPHAGASSRYRVYQYLPHLEALGVRCDVQSFMDAVMYRRFFSPGGTVAKAWLMLKAFARRLRVVARFRDYDIIYLQRELLPFAPLWLERYMKNRGAVLFFDYDDALFINKPSRKRLAARYRRQPWRFCRYPGGGRGYRQNRHAFTALQRPARHRRLAGLYINSEVPAPHRARVAAYRR